MGGVLEGLRVLDFGRYIAGPYCATLLAEFGAEVIRVEKRGGSEDRFVAPVGEGGEGALFLQINRNKKCITLDPMKPEGQEVMGRLVTTADVVVANLPPQTLRAMKLDYESLKAIKPDIILTTATAFGGPGPWSDRVGFDGVGQVMSGSVYMTGAGDPPYRAAVNWVDFGTALHCAFGTLAALIERGKSGRGQIVEGALLATALSFTNATLIEQAVIKANRVPTGNLGQTAAPADIYRTKDGWVLCQVTGHPLFIRWARLMGEEDQWLSDPRFADDIKRGDNGPVISERMARWCAERTTQEAVDTLGGAMIPAGPVLSPQQALDIRIFAPPASCRMSIIRACRYQRRSYELPSGYRKRQVKSWRARRCLASTPTLCWPNSAMTRLRLRRFDKSASFSGYLRRPEECL